MNSIIHKRVKNHPPYSLKVTHLGNWSNLKSDLYLLPCRSAVYIICSCDIDCSSSETLGSLERKYILHDPVCGASNKEDNFIYQIYGAGSTR